MARKKAVRDSGKKPVVSGEVLVLRKDGKLETKGRTKRSSIRPGAWKRNLFAHNTKTMIEEYLKRASPANWDEVWEEASAAGDVRAKLGLLQIALDRGCGRVKERIESESSLSGVPMEQLDDLAELAREDVKAVEASDIEDDE